MKGRHMFTVERASINGKPGYLIRTGDKKKGGYLAQDLKQVHRAAKHFFQDPPHEDPVLDCPLCLASEAEDLL